MPLYLDEDLASKELASRLRATGHTIIPALRGQSDEEAWKHAQDQGAAIVTQNAKDFIALAEATSAHYGLLIVYRDNDPNRDMTIAQLATAIDRALAAFGADLAGRIINLSQFRATISPAEGA